MDNYEKQKQHVLDEQKQALNEIDKQFHQTTLRERLKRLVRGLSAPKDSRDYKLARIEAQRLAAPAIAITLPLLLLLIAAVVTMNIRQPEKPETFPVAGMPEKPVEPIEPIEPPPPTATIHDTPDTPSGPGLPALPAVPVSTPQPPLSPVGQPTPWSHVTVREKAKLKEIGEGGGSTPRTANAPPETEAAVMRGLRWLKKNQNPDGSWSSNKPAMTGLALLCFLAHGEIPGRSEEFGDTVRNGLQYLMASYNGATFNGTDGNEYAYLIATYALCEAYGMTRNPNIRTLAETALKRLIDGQHPSGGWDYKMAQTDRDDTSYMGWAAQALKAAQVAGLFDNDPAWRTKLDTACKRSNNGFLKNGAPGGGFGYTGPARGGLTAVGTLCMQFNGAARHRQVADSLKLMEAWKPGWFDQTGDVTKLGLGGSLQYYYYYATQSKFIEGGRNWNNWNAAMKTTYEKAQKILPAAIAGPGGKLHDIGWWENADNHSDRPVMDTCLAILQLEVYYRGDKMAVLNTPVIDPEILSSLTSENEIKIKTDL